MASKHAARLAGDDFQHLYSWWLILGLKLPGENIQKVIVENGQAGSVDDVTTHYAPDDITINHEPGTTSPDRFYQVKYHVDQRGVYSSKNLIEANNNKTESLLEKFWSTWKQLCKQTPGRVVELYLISNQTWESGDPLGKWVSGKDDSIKVNEFMAQKPDSTIGKIRGDWQLKLKASDEDFAAFINSLHFRLGYSASVLLDEQVVERMKRLKLKTDPTTLKAIAGIVRDWIITNKHEITLDMLEATLLHYNYYLPTEEERCITIYLDTIEKSKYPKYVDYKHNWTKYFVELPNKLKGSQLINSADWHATLLPELYTRKAQVKQTTGCHLISAHGNARLSPWFAFGHVFSEVAGFRIKFHPEKGGSWRTDATASSNFPLIITSDQGSLDGEIIHGTGETVAVGISITTPETSIDTGVRNYVLTQQSDKIIALLLLRSTVARIPDGSNGEEAIALARTVKDYASAFAHKHHARRMLLFYRGPAGVACFIGYLLNKICDREVQIMEHQPGGEALYAPSFLLTM